MKRTYVVCVRIKYNKEYYPILTADTKQQAKELYNKWKEEINKYPGTHTWVENDYYIVSAPHNTINSWILDGGYDKKY